MFTGISLWILLKLHQVMTWTLPHVTCAIKEVGEMYSFTWLDHECATFQDLHASSIRTSSLSTSQNTNPQLIPRLLTTFKPQEDWIVDCLKAFPKTVVSKSPGPMIHHKLVRGQAGYSTSSAQKLSPGIYLGQEKHTWKHSVFPWLFSREFKFLMIGMQGFSRCFYC